MKIIMTTLAASLIVLLAACTKNESPVNAPAISTNTRLALQSMAASPAANAQNPYDYIGYFHNIGLDSLRHYVKATGDTTRRGKYGYVSRYFKSNFGADVRLAYNENEKLACTDYKVLWFNQKISDAAMMYWHRLSDAVHSIKDLDHYPGYRQQIAGIENEITADKLPADEKKNLLLTASILRYSGYYWMNAFKSGEVVYHSNGSGLAMPDSFLRKVAGVITGICADASVIAAGYMSGDYAIIGYAFWLSSICGYYTGWW